ncbi:MAG: hypothetical protein VYB82_08345, partial [Pseudomonadota bacterium]|nr:hypothetical protein [Pseudomonadota bacterium]
NRNDNADDHAGGFGRKLALYFAINPTESTKPFKTFVAGQSPYATTANPLWQTYVRRFFRPCQG